MKKEALSRDAEIIMNNLSHYFVIKNAVKCREDDPQIYRLRWIGDHGSKFDVLEEACIRSDVEQSDLIKAWSMKYDYHPDKRKMTAYFIEEDHDPVATREVEYFLLSNKVENPYDINDNDYCIIFRMAKDYGHFIETMPIYLGDSPEEYSYLTVASELNKEMLENFLRKAQADELLGKEYQKIKEESDYFAKIEAKDKIINAFRPIFENSCKKNQI